MSDAIKEPAMRRRSGLTLQERIVALVHDRRLEPGAAMPTETQLMDQLGASRNSVREAIRALQALGIVEIRHGHGTFVGTASLAALSPSLSFRVRSGEGALRDLVEARELLETGLIGEVAGTLSDARLAALDALVARMLTDPEADKSFHALLYESCGNELVLQLIGLFWDVYHEAVEARGYGDSDVVANHSRIVGALRTGNSAEARDAMRHHFTEVKARIGRTSGHPTSHVR
jgi:DNA-binding FadR family transcriptional regulator